jgi:hypothetical protein
MSSRSLRGSSGRAGGGAQLQKTLGNLAKSAVYCDKAPLLIAAGQVSHEISHVQPFPTCTSTQSESTAQDWS